MATPASLQPTLWRTCRVLANRKRLRIFGLLLREPGLAVSAVADRLKLPVPVASQYLRAMEARGLLAVRRLGSRVYYRVRAVNEAGPAQPLVESLWRLFQRGGEPIEQIFKLATAFTHPRRIDLYQALRGGARTVNQLHVATGISRFSLWRHLAKLEARGFVTGQAGFYEMTSPEGGFGHALARLAGAQR